MVVSFCLSFFPKTYLCRLPAGFEYNGEACLVWVSLHSHESRKELHPRHFPLLLHMVSQRQHSSTKTHLKEILCNLLSACECVFACFCLHLQMQGVHLLHFQHCGLSLVILILQTSTVFQRYLQSFQAAIITAVTEHMPKLTYCPHNLTWS